MSNTAAEENAKQARQFVNFAFYRVSPEWLRKSCDEREAGVSELAQVVRDYERKILLYPYTTFGVRAETDFLLWRISFDLDDFEEMSAAIRRTEMGKYLETPHSFLAMTKTSIYIADHVHEGQEAARNRIVVGDAKYLFVYPFVKSREWYLMSKDDRLQVMKQHIVFGHGFPSVKLNTTYSFGLDDQDFVVAFESNKPEDFLDLVQGLRETESSKYTVRDTPIFTCTRRSIETILNQTSGL